MSEIFVRASRQKLRFKSSKGLVSTEDLWKMTLIALDKIARSVNAELNAAGEKSFIDDTSQENSELKLKLDVLVYVIEYQKKQKEAVKKRAETLTKKQLLDEAIAESEMAELKGKSTEELRKMRDNLGCSSEICCNK